ncbi:hypothetical protein ACH492_25640 [Streptomyces sp. NPDC019443]|uniref:hypothetical protein n=1 Tax=Streptomyces sp. NPDC019443 TaxID=3365061 RepID=UPI0037B11625
MFDDTSAKDLATQAAEKIRQLNHATQGAKGELTYPGDAYEVVASLKCLTQRLPQSFDQLSDFLETFARTGSVTADYGVPDDHLAEACSALASAAMVAQTLSEYLDRAHSALAPLGYDATGRQPAPVPRWPAPETAYALAPNITSELGWTDYDSVGRPTGALLGRELWLRKAAVLDRVALAEDQDQSGDAVELATEAARRLIEFDRAGEDQYAGVPHGPDHPDTKANPRAYVRQEYAAWQRHQ